MLRIAVLFVLTAAFAAGAELEREFEKTVSPFLEQYCTGCHGGDSPASQLDLSVYTSVDSVIRDHRHWAHVLERLSDGEMPPKAAPQPATKKRERVVQWIEDVRADVAGRNAGDPGPVLARRLSNAEYNYTIRDLTGVDIRPTREFPVDPANPEGFDNSGESLMMSPALLGKYLQAAREVGDHMVLTPDGFGFAPHPMIVITDREKYAIQNVVDFYYRQPTDFADYFEAAWRYKHRALLGMPDATLAEVAKESGVSSGYLPMVWRLLEGTSNNVGPTAKLRSMWQAANTPTVHWKNPPRVLCEAMRDFVVKIRQQTMTLFMSPEVDGLSATSQPLMNWKLRQYAAHRRDFDRSALRTADEVVPDAKDVPARIGLGIGRNAESRAWAIQQNARRDDQDLVYPEGKREEYEAALAEFSSVFPDAFYISERGRFFPDDSEDKGRLLSAGYHNVMGFFRDDTPLIELILDDDGKEELDRLWTEFDFIADYKKRTWVQYFFNQSGEILGNGRESGSERPSDEAVSAEPVVFGLRDQYLEKVRENPDNDRIAIQAVNEHFELENRALRTMERLRREAEPRHLEALVDFAERAYRRPLTDPERDDILGYYETLKSENGLTHEEAVRDSVVSVLMSPDFCYRLDLVDPSGTEVTESTPAGRPLSAFAVANRLSYFLWSSMPDEELLKLAASGELTDQNVLLEQVRRMLSDDRVRGLATEFAGNWLDFRRFESHNSVDRETFPTFDNDLRQAMFEEPVRFIEDVIRNDRPVVEALFGKHTFVNPPLARHYGIPNIEGDVDQWVRVDDAFDYQRGGLLPMSVFLTKNSPGLRTSPVQRGYWMVRRVLGEVIPPPPPVVPELPADESKSEKSVPELLASHRANPACASCHQRFDSFGLAFESYGPVGEKRRKDLAGRYIEDTAEYPDGTVAQGFEGLKEYVRSHRTDDYLDNLARKLLAYALNRSLILSDEPVIEQMGARLRENNFRFRAMVETIVTTPQFLNRRTNEPTAGPERGE